MLIFTERQWRIFNRIRRKYKVSLEFLKYNMPNILKFIAYYGRRLHFVLKRTAERNSRNRSVVIKYNRLMRSLFDEAYRKRIKRRKRNIKLWSKRMVLHLRKTNGVREYTVVKKLRNSVQNPILPEDLTKQLKEQLELLRTGKRSTQLMDCSLSEGEMKSRNSSLEVMETLIEYPLDESSRLDEEKQQQFGEFILNERTGILENGVDENTSKPNEDTVIVTTNRTPENTKSNANILDVLMSKVRCSQMKSTTKSVSSTSLHIASSDTSLDSGEEFLGFAEDENVPGMMRTPLVPSIFGSREENSVFVSESLDEYFRENSLNRSVDIGKFETLPSHRRLRQANINGLMTLNSKAPAFEMPAVPESLQKLRTVAERRHFLQKFSKNFKLAIINNEAAIYREMQRKIRQPKTKICSQQAMQANTSQMSFTRKGWQAASFATTELNKFFFQKLFLPDEKIYVELRGVRGNNTDQYKTPYVSKITSEISFKCSINCIDCCIAKCLKPISTYGNRKKLCREPFRAIFKPCPLSEKPRQPFLDEDAAEILLSGGGMTIVRLPTIQLQIHPELGKPLNDVAKRYLQYILPYEEITREWAEFSTSTLQVPSQAHSKNQKNILKTFAFTVPYVNDRSHILVRRVVDRSETVDPHFLHTSVEKNWSGLSFFANIDNNDSTEVECASVLADMINSVAISCSENSFIKDDSEAMNKTEDYNSKAPKEKFKGRPRLPANQKTTSGPKKSRLICELRRLNATIIETNAQHKNDVRRCSKEFCALGCVCQSLSNGYPLQQHCGKPKCMLQCACKGSTPSKVLRIETDGRSITTEDAYNMRLQATARLARIEKEFTSTVVVTENETLLINETEYDKKRRCTKVPKRYQDYRDTDNEFGRISPVKSCSTPLVDANESRSSPATTISEVMSGLQEPIYVKDFILSQLKHCSIPLIPFKETQNMAIWCMIHHMYKCFCGGHSLEGKRLIIEKEDNKAVSIFDNDGKVKPNFSSKAYYSFESTEDDLNHSVPISRPTKRKSSEEMKHMEFKNLTVDYRKPDTSENVNVNKSAEKSSKIHVENEFLKNFFKDREYLGCSRFIPVPSRTYKSINRKRRKQILKDVEFVEDSKSQLLLNEHIMRSVYYHKEKLIPEKVKQKIPDNNIIKQEEYLEEVKEDTSIIASEKECLENAVTEQLETEPRKTTKNLQTAEKKLKISRKGEKIKESKPKKPKRSLVPIDDMQPAEKKVKKCVKDRKKKEREPGKPKISLVSIDNSQPVEKKPKKSDKLEKIEQSKGKDVADSNFDEKGVLVAMESEPISKISGCYSVKSQNERTEPNRKIDMSADAGLSPFSEGWRENYNEVIKMLNNLVSRKMRDIDNALKRDSKIIPPPTENVLCVLQWKNFLGAFQDGLIYIWEVKMKTRSFLAATVQNMIPMVLGALAVISITQTTLQQLPLIGQMVLQGYILDESVNLAVIMQGRLHYWFIKGFLQPNVANACLRPTPETHPELTKKINTLCSSLIKQRTKDLERREAAMKRRESKGIVASFRNFDESLSNSSKQQNQQESVLLTSPSCMNKTTNQQNQIEIPHLEQNKIFDDTKFRQSNWVSNIDLQSPESLDTEEIQMPESHENDHSWYVLDLCNDFSHIFVPIQKEIVSLDRIQRLISLSMEKQKVIRIQFLKRACFDAFIVPSSKRKIYFGPFPLNAEPPLLVLLQSVDGKMMTREAYQQMHKIPRKSALTTSFWLKQINGKICFDEPAPASEPVKSPSIEIENSGSQLIADPIQTTSTSETILDEDCEDDCIIIESTSDSSRQPENSDLRNLSKHLQQVEAILQQTKSLNQKSQSVANITNPQYGTPQIPENFTNCDFQTLNTRNELESIKLDANKKINEIMDPIDGLTKHLIIQKTSLGQIRLQPNKNYKTQPISSMPIPIDGESLTKKSSIGSSVNTVQMGSTKSIASTIISNVTTATKTSSFQSKTKVLQLPKIAVNDLNKSSTADYSLDDLQRTVIITNRPATAVSKSTDNNWYPTSTVIASKVVKTSPFAVQSITAKGMSSNVLESNNRTNTKTTAVSATTSSLTTGTIITTVSPGNKGPTSNILKYNIPHTSVTQAQTPAPQQTISHTSIPTSTLTPIGSKERNIPVKRLSSGIIKLPQNLLNSAKTAPSLTSASNLQQDTVHTSNTINTVQTNAAAISGISKMPVHLNRIPPTTTSGQHVPPWPIKLNAAAKQPMRLIGNPDSSAATSSSNPVLIPSSSQKIDQHVTCDPFTTGKSNTNAIGSIYGYLCSNLPGIPRFLAKRTQFEYLIKVPGFGLARANGIVKANAFLNQHVAKNWPLPKRKNIWTFVPHTKTASIKNKGNNAQNNISIQQKPNIEKEKNIAPPATIRSSSSISTFKPKLTFRQINQRTSKIEKNISLTQLLSNVNETILIDDD